MAEHVLITGGAGFIGSHLADAYLAAGHTVAILDNLSTGRRAYLPETATFFEADLADATAVDEALEQFKPTLISHHAGQINVRKSLESPSGDARTNIMGGLVLLEAALRHEVGHFIFSSTGGAMYGDTDNRPTPSTAPPNPLSPYGIAKYTFEEYLRVIGGLHEMAITVFRYANIYGPRQIIEGEAGVVAIFSQQLLAGNAPRIYGSGENTRDYLHVSDVVAANMLVSAQKLTGLFNLGTGIETSVNDLYAMLQAAAQSDIPAEHVPARLEEIAFSSLDAAPFRSATNWAPQVKLAEGLSGTVAWFASGNPR